MLFTPPVMEPMLEEFAAVARSVSFSPPKLPMISNLSGQPAADQELISPDYWVRAGPRKSVRFLSGVQCLDSAGVSRFLELALRRHSSVMVRPMPDRSQDTLRRAGRCAAMARKPTP